MRSYQRIERTIVETSNTITIAEVIHEFTIDDENKTESWIAKHTKLTKGKTQHDLTHYTPRFGQM